MYKYALSSIRTMLGLKTTDIVTAVVNNRIPFEYKGDMMDIDSYYTNQKGLTYFKVLSRKRTASDVGGVGTVQ